MPDFDLSFATPVAPETTLVDTMRELDAVRREILGHEDAIKPLQERRRELEEAITAQASTLGIETLPKVEGIGKIILATRTVAKADNAQVAAWLRERGLEHMLTCNHQTFQAHVREMIEAGEELPGFIQVIEMSDVRWHKN